mmetsp:Transcript_127109/g.220295  ORF Transcript_127109/g.220295 Transcript_127109/m.220295 type:complete len:82 (+) Transcript_127109:281-526(+)
MPKALWKLRKTCGETPLRVYALQAGPETAGAFFAVLEKQGSIFGSHAPLARLQLFFLPRGLPLPASTAWARLFLVFQLHHG